MVTCQSCGFQAPCRPQTAPQCNPGYTTRVTQVTHPRAPELALILDAPDERFDDGAAPELSFDDTEHAALLP
jgi:hypothetical protein